MTTTLTDLNTASRDAFVAALANVFEHSPWIAEQVAMKRPFAGLAALFAAMKGAVERAPTELRLALIKAHPDLADKTQRAAGLTAEVAETSRGRCGLRLAVHDVMRTAFLPIIVIMGSSSLAHARLSPLACKIS